MLGRVKMKYIINTPHLTSLISIVEEKGEPYPYILRVGRYVVDSYKYLSLALEDVATTFKVAVSDISIDVS